MSTRETGAFAAKSLASGLNLGVERVPAAHLDSNRVEVADPKNLHNLVDTGAAEARVAVKKQRPGVGAQRFGSIPT